MCYKSLPNRVIVKALSLTWSTGSEWGSRGGGGRKADPGNI